MLSTIEFHEKAIGSRHQIFVLRKVVRGQRHPTSEFRHNLRPIGIRERLEFIEKFLGGCAHGPQSPILCSSRQVQVHSETQRPALSGVPR